MCGPSRSAAAALGPPSTGRRAEIVRTASDLIRQRGYGGVAMKDVADALGVTAPSLYRHFPSKQALLSAAISDGFEVAEAAATEGERAGLDALIRALAEAAVDQRNLWVLVHRESRHLDQATRATMSRRLDGLVAKISGTIRSRWPDADSSDADMLARAALAALSAPSQYRQKLPKGRLPVELAKAANRVVRVDFSSKAPGATPSLRHSPLFNPELSRRESILAAAANLFARRGYQDVTVGDIGAAVSIAGPSIYNHFRGKPEILACVLWRSLDWIESDMASAVATHDSTEGALLQLYCDYTDLAVHNPEMFEVFSVEGVHLPAFDRSRIRRAHNAFVDRWVALLQSAQPGLGLGDARARVTASLCIINDVGRLIPRDDESVDGCEKLVLLALAAAGL